MQLFSPSSSETAVSGLLSCGSDRNSLVAVVERDVALAQLDKVSLEHDQAVLKLDTLLLLAVNMLFMSAMLL